MNSKKKNIESQIVEDFEKIRPAITRLLQSQMNNENLSIIFIFLKCLESAIDSNF